MINNKFMNNAIENPDISKKGVDKGENVEVIDKKSPESAIVKPLSAMEITEQINKDSEITTAGIEKARQAINKEQEKGDGQNDKEKEKLLSLAKAKLDEISQRVDELSKKMFGPSELQVNVARSVINKGYKEINQIGKVPDFPFLLDQVKIVKKVDVSMFPTEKLKKTGRFESYTPGY